MSHAYELMLVTQSTAVMFFDEGKRIDVSWKCSSTQWGIVAYRDGSVRRNYWKTSKS